MIKSVIGEATAENKDNLKKISGVGPVYEEKLNSLGIYTFEQVSKLTPESIQAIEELTKYFPGRIEREDWMSQAKKLMEG
jgi:predicted flap endonuclease-1-like 5' DNA nuclease